MIDGWTTQTATRLSELILGCIHREYPNQVAHVMQSADDAGTPRSFTPAFFGCYDWHSAVHAHWSLIRLVRAFPGEDSGFPTQRVIEVLGQGLTDENLRQEQDYLTGPGRTGFERPYGLAWLLTLCLELREIRDEQPQLLPCEQWLAALSGLESLAEQRIVEWLPRLTWPIRNGEHSQSAFAMGLVWDWATACGNEMTLEVIADSAVRFHSDDRDYNFSYEPSGQDFLSPGLAAADLMRRVFDADSFSCWFEQYLPSPAEQLDEYLQPVIPSDRADGKIAHLDGLNLSRAWMLEGIAAALTDENPLYHQLRQAADRHATTGLEGVTGEHYSGAHWLGTFAVYYLSRRGLGEFLSMPSASPAEMEHSEVRHEQRLDTTGPTTTMTSDSEEFAWQSIRLDQFLKIAGLVDTGGQAKLVIQGGEVVVNGQIETRRRRQLRSGDTVEYAGEELEIDFSASDDDSA